jgi:hypothetical protein
MFQATHEITVTSPNTTTGYTVMLCENEGGWSRGHCAGEYRIGPAYTQAEWEAGAPADWELTETGWKFKGRTAPTNHSTVFVSRITQDSYIVRLNHLWSEAATLRAAGIKKNSPSEAMAAASVMSFITIGRCKAERLANGPDGLPSDYYPLLVAESETKLRELKERLSTK